MEHGGGVILTMPPLRRYEAGQGDRKPRLAVRGKSSAKMKRYKWVWKRVYRDSFGL